MALRAVSNSALTAKSANQTLQPFRARRRFQFATVRSRGLRLDVEPLGSPSHRNMRLPSAERAVVDEAKVRGYLLAAKHPVSRFKAAFFRTLVYTPTDWLHLQQSLVAHALTAEAIPESASPLWPEVPNPCYASGAWGRSAVVVSIWIIRAGDDLPRLVTAFPGDSR